MENLNLKDKYWLAGLIEGEGCFCINRNQNKTEYPGFKMNMCDEDIIAKAANILNHKYSISYKTIKEKPVYLITFTGKKAYRLMQLMHPLMGKRRQSKINEIMDRIGHKYGHQP